MLFRATFHGQSLCNVTKLLLGLFFYLNHLVTWLIAVRKVEKDISFLKYY